VPLIVVTAVASEPVEIDEIKAQCRVESDQTEQDALLLMHAKTARMWLEEVTGRSFGEQTFELVLDRFPEQDEVFSGNRLIGPYIKLPRAPLIEVESVKYIDTDGTLTTMDPADYLVDGDSVPGRIAPAADSFWPATQFRQNAVRVRFRAGYANDSPATDELPEPLKQALLLQTQAIYDGMDLSMPINALISPYRHWGF